MSDTETTTEAPESQPAAAATADPAPEPTAPDDTLGDAGKRALQAERDARKTAEKAAAELAAKLKEIEDRDLSEKDRLAKALQEAQETAAKASAEALRLRIAAELNVPADLHEFLVGDSEEELRAKAQKLAAMAPAGKSQPKPDPSQGAKPGTTGPTQLTQSDLDRMTPDEVAGALREGRLADVLAGK